MSTETPAYRPSASPRGEQGRVDLQKKMPFSLEPKELESKKETKEKKGEEGMEEEIHFQWSYLPPRWLGFLRFGILPLLILLYLLFSQFFRDKIRILDPFLPLFIALLTFLWNRISQKASPKEYALTSKGIYVRGVGSKKMEISFPEMEGLNLGTKRRWQRMGTWRDFRMFERERKRILLKGRSRFSRSISLYYNGDLSTGMRIVEVVSRFIGR